MFYITPYDFCQWNLNSGFQSSLAGFRIPNAEFRIPKSQAKTFPVPDSGLHQGTVQRAGKTCDLFCCKTSWIERFHSRGQHLCKFIETKEIVCIRKEFNCDRTGLGHQYGRRFIFLENPIWPPWRHLKTLYSDFACFTTHESNLSCNKSDGCRLRKVESSSIFVARVLPAQSKLVLRQVT